MRVMYLPNKRGRNFLWWLWEATNILQPIRFHDVQREIDTANGGHTIHLHAGDYKYYTPVRLSRPNVTIQGVERK